MRRNRRPAISPFTFVRLAALLLLAGAWPAAAERYSVRESQTIEKTLSFPNASADNLLVVDNINGSIRLAGHDGGEVRVVARETLRARSADHRDRARREAGLEITAEGSTLSLIVDGPFRRDDGSIQWNDDLGYELHYEFTIEVPRSTRIDLRNVNGGDVEVEGVEGRSFEVSNVNGAVEMRGVAGHGRAHTVNGGVDVRFAALPDDACSFKTINGNIDVELPEGLAADLRFKTFNGDVYTDFDYEERAVERPAPRQSGGRTTWKSLGHGARIGGGGPEMSFDTLNGNIYIKKTER